MRRAAKGDGYGNVFLEDAPIPTISSRQVLVRTHTSLISRGSEILRRYREHGPVDPAIMGYSVAGVVVEAGDEARSAGYAPGDRVFVQGPHAEYVVGTLDPDGVGLRKLAHETPWYRAPFQSLAFGAVAWSVASRSQPADVVAVLGQGLVGNLVMQAQRLRGVGRVIAVDTLDLRLRLSRELGADAAVDAARADAVAEVRRLTGGKGADVVVDCVGGPPGVRSFEQALEMVKDDGIVHLIGLYHGRPLALDSAKIQRKMLIGGYHLDEPWGPLADRAAGWIASGRLQVEPLITHRFPAKRVADAFALLDRHLDQAMGVLLEWLPPEPTA